MFAWRLSDEDELLPLVPAFRLRDLHERRLAGLVQTACSAPATLRARGAQLLGLERGVCELLAYAGLARFLAHGDRCGVSVTRSTAGWQRYRQLSERSVGRAAAFECVPKCFSNSSRMSSKTPMRANPTTTVGCFAGSLRSRSSKARSSARVTARSLIAHA